VFDSKKLCSFLAGHGSADAHIIALCLLHTLAAVMSERKGSDNDGTAPDDAQANPANAPTLVEAVKAVRAVSGRGCVCV
jgi:hypothetical protein